MVWIIRQARVADAPAVSELASLTFPLACPPGFSADAVAEHIRGKLSPDAIAITMAGQDAEYSVAWEQRRAVGYLLLVAGGESPPAPQEGLLELRQIYVHPEFFGSGLANDLMAVAIDRAADHAGLWLGTSQVNERALRFYRKHGFVVVAERTFMVGPTPNRDWVLVRTNS